MLFILPLKNRIIYYFSLYHYHHTLRRHLQPRYIALASVSIFGLLVYFSSISSVMMRSSGVSSDLQMNSTRDTMKRRNSNVDRHLTESSKILCYILLSSRKVIAAKSIIETWGSRCDKLVFYGRFQSSQLSVTFLNTTEGYAYLWGKTKAAILHIHREYSKEYDWFVKADDDTFLIIENLRKFVSRLTPSQPLWFGFKLRDKNMKQGYMSGGAGYVFSKSALQKLSSLLQGQAFNIPISSSSCDLQGQKGYEDLELGKCCIVAGIREINSRDEEGRERFLPLSLSALLNQDLSKFHWIRNQAWNPVQLGEKCCSPELISMHQISPKQMKTLYFLLYQVQGP